MGGSEELHPCKRQRTQTLAQSSSPITAKGKEKMEESAAGAGPDEEACPPPDATCGICLTDGGVSTRGRIDSCDHFFCFFCIMEWAKIESRCPTCKRRFRSIRRPPVRGLFSCERIVNVPHRDQGSDPFGDQSTEFSDPYENINCSTCQSLADEDLLLLCDLCDSAHHTYCVGLGFTVPEGDWYCHDCTIYRDEHSNSLSDAGCYKQINNINTDAVGISDTPSSLSGIVSNATNLDSLQSFPRFSTARLLEEQRNGDRPPSKTTSACNVPAGETVSRPSSRNTSLRKSQDSILHMEHTVPVGETVSSTQAGSDKGARTLHRCRNLHSRIRVLRENWDYLRAGSLVFSSSSFCGNGKIYDKNLKGNKVSSDMPTTSSSIRVNGSQVTLDENVSGEKQRNRGSQDVSREWKMMEIAKSIEGSKRSTILNHSLNICGRTKRTGNLQSTSLSKSNISSQKVAASSELEHFRKIPLKTVQSKCKPEDYEKQNLYMETMKEVKQTYIGSGNSHLSINSKVSCSKQGRFSLDDIYDEKEKPTSQWFLHKAPISFIECDSYSNSADYLHPEASIQTITNTIESSRSEVENHRRRQNAFTCADESLIKRNGIAKSSLKGRNADQNQTRRDDIANNSAKGEVQSLVKLNLKLLNKERHLDEVYVSFHDECWGVPVYTDSQLFELLVLSGMLIDLNWTEILKRRELYRDVFAKFDYSVVAKMEEKDVMEISSNKELILAECRVRCIVENARCIQKVAKEFGSFSGYIWGHMNHRPMINRYKYPRSIPLRTPKAEAISRDLIRRGFRLVGPVIVYSFMQAAGMAIDHLVDCFRFSECVRVAVRSWGMTNMAM